ncbi:MAG: OsmC family protein [Promethearchaeota archaeon]
MNKDDAPVPEFKAVIKWTGGHDGEIAMEGKPSLPISSPPFWGGHGGRYSPQELFVSAITGCYVTTFGEFIKRMNQPIEALKIEGRGILERHPEGGFLFTHIYITMHISVKDEAASSKAQKAVDLTKKYCMVSRSVSCNVHVTSKITHK